MIPATEQQNPLMVYTEIIYFEVLIPENLTASLFAPTAKTILPKTVVFKTRCTIIQSPKEIATGTGIMPIYPVPMN